MSFELNTTQKTVCKLISAAMFHTKETFAADVDWDAVRDEMRAQTVQGLVLDVLPELPISDDLKKSWRNECLRIMKNNILLRSEQSNFLNVLDEAGIPYVILKGTAAAMYYPNPLLRAMGDVDVFVPACFHLQVKKILRSENYTLRNEEKGNYRHLVFFKNNIIFEVHQSFATVNGNKEKKYIDNLLESGTGNNTSGNMLNGKEEHSFKVPQTNVNGIVLLEHIGQHLTAGLGLRQIIDWMMFVNKCLHDDEWGSFEEIAQKAGLKTLAETATKLCVENCGLNGAYTWCMDADDNVVKYLLEYLFDSGNFGSKNYNKNLVASLEHHYKNSKNILISLQKTGEHNWPLYKKYHWVRPLAWIYQLVRYIIKVFSHPQIIKEFKSGSREARRRLVLMNGLGIYKEKK